MKAFVARYPIRLPAFALLLQLALFAFAGSAFGQIADMDECSGGRLYYIPFPDTVTNLYDGRFPAELIRTNTTSFVCYIYSPVDQRVVVGRVNGAGQEIALSAGQIYEYDTRNVGVPLTTVINTPRTSVLHIRAEYPVIVYAYMLTPFGTEAFTPLPVEAWGREYVAGTWPGETVKDILPGGQFNFRQVAAEAPAQILIVAAYSNTQVRITPKAPLAECAGCNQVTLQAGETYLVQSVVDTARSPDEQYDLAGTTIEASKPVGVVAGNTRLMHIEQGTVALGKNSFKNLAMEWMTPAEQHGTEFVFTPTWDDRRRREGLPADESRMGERVRIFSYGAETSEVVWYDPSGQARPAADPFLKRGEFTEERVDTPAARLYRATGPLMAMMSPEAVIKFNDERSQGSGPLIASYFSWSTYMTELVPREQWTSFAPVRAPSLPLSMVNYLNVVTDTGNIFNIYYRQGSGPPRLFPFNRDRVPGSDLIWGSIPLDKGTDYFIEGGNGARFTGHVYGSYRGMEEFREGNSGEYEENVALMYGYPLAPSRCVLADPDIYEIETSDDCGALVIHIRAKNSPASGIRSVTLLADSSENVRIEFVDPVDPEDFTSQKITDAQLRLVPIDPQQDTRGVVIVRDRTRNGQRIRIPYSRNGERFDIVPAALDFGEVTLNTSSGERTLAITNPLPDKDIVIRRLSLALGTEGFTIAQTEPAFSWVSGVESVTLKPGETLKVWIDIVPNTEREFLDSLRIHTDCAVRSVPLTATTVRPCIFINDLDFGTMNIGSGTGTLPLEICNAGRGEVTFREPWCTWLQTTAQEQGFDVDQADIDKLHGLTLGPNECVTVRVSFTPPAEPGKGGRFRTTARFWANTRDCRDTSIWRANVIEPGPQIDGYNWGERWLSENSCTKNPVERYEATLQARNSGESPFEVVSLAIMNDPDGVFSILNTTIAPGLIIQPSDMRDIEVAFDPAIEKVYYSPVPATIRLAYRINLGDRDSTGYVEAPLEGIGIESYASVSDYDFGNVRYAGPGSAAVPGRVTITSTGTRPVSIEQVKTGNDDFRLAAAWAAANPWATAADGNVLSLAPGSAITVDLEFAPTNHQPTEQEATIELIGDFAYDYCSRTDSSGRLTGRILRASATAEGYDFGSILTCQEKDGHITVRNDGNEPVRIAAINAVTPAGMSPYFEVNFEVDGTEGITLPYVLLPQEEVKIPLRFAPDRAGIYEGSVEIVVASESGDREVARLTPSFSGTAEVVSGTMSIARDHHGSPGSAVVIPVVLETELDRAMIRDMILSIEYDNDVLGLGGLTPGELFPESEGWMMETLDKGPGFFTVRLYNNAGRFVGGTGNVLLMEFFPLNGDKKQTEIEFTPTFLLFGENFNTCADIAASPGFFTIDANDPDSEVSLTGISPNPLKDFADIEFRLPRREHVRISVYSSDGRRVALLYDDMMEAGTHGLLWNAVGLIKGAYYVQIKAGDATDSRGVRIIK